ncbi:MAG: GxxExxY protein [Planctomycetales bacterium]|nr:GxxExxY protein [Planctomycetales bacterium]
MPIHCPTKIESLTTEGFGLFDYSLMGHIFASQNGIGRLADERIYQADVAQRLAAAGMATEIETPITLVHKTFAKELFLDLVVCQRAVYEFKTVSALSSNHVAQLLTYLYVLDLRRGKLVNFRSSLSNGLILVLIALLFARLEEYEIACWDWQEDRGRKIGTECCSVRDVLSGS